MQALDRSRCRGKGLGSSSRREKQEVGRSPWKELDSGMGGRDSVRIKSGKKKKPSGEISVRAIDRSDTTC